ncbi:MAG: SDR family NAD(P)-dependent oxidoreductase [Pigmentiphaga sp.]|uniref:SDR family NAD(P)-dependent oxidoreductase n=1 Tax=Pigmentiphaga sp. TaxID=1977564 RepID=UPI0029ACB696|nr:SDR family NAD(P)-dependent oxidoreductase [Pigmentiphaga sp.]MDX3906263.1 SDR family NAD(P)-dependent oxidoreductase [Pigmentiphaga sp.]
MTFRLQGKTALVTGGGGGIGEAIGRLFVAEGARIVLVDADAQALARTAARIQSPQVATQVCDISDEAQVGALAAFIGQEGGKLDILVNNAAVREYHRLADADAASWQRILAVNVTGTALVTAAMLPYLRDSGRGAVVNVASTFGLSGRGGMGQYDATKAAMIAATRVLAIEEARHGVRANAVCPGSVLTGFTLGRAAARGMTENELVERGCVPAPINRWGDPAEIAAPVLWLASDEASFITGAVLPVDGGVSASGTRLA